MRRQARFARVFGRWCVPLRAMTVVDRDAWTGVIRRDPVGPVLQLDVPIQQSAQGSSGTYRALCSDGKEWWVKPINQLQGGKTIVNDQVLARVGLLIAAPVCKVSLVEVTADTEGFEFRPGQFTVAGLSHGSAHIGDPLVEDRNLRDRNRDDNARRHAGMFALWDWCCGGDDQWLYAGAQDNQAYAHDLGHFLPGMNNWTVDTLTGAVNDPHVPPWPTPGLDIGEVNRLADALEAIDQRALLSALNGVPSTWPVTDAELETLGWFLHVRAIGVSQRLRLL